MSDLRKLAEGGLANPWRKGETNFKYFHCRAALEQATTPDAILALLNQIDALRAENARVAAESVDMLTISADAIRAIEAERDALRSDAERFNFLCDCDNTQALDILCEQLGQREGLISLVDELIKERSES